MITTVSNVSKFSHRRNWEKLMDYLQFNFMKRRNEPIFYDLRTQMLGTAMSAFRGTEMSALLLHTTEWYIFKGFYQFQFIQVATKGFLLDNFTFQLGSPNSVKSKGPLRFLRTLWFFLTSPKSPTLSWLCEVLQNLKAASENYFPLLKFLLSFYRIQTTCLWLIMFYVPIIYNEQAGKDIFWSRYVCVYSISSNRSRHQLEAALSLKFLSWKP